MTSLTDKQIHELKSFLNEVIQEKVNGKIDKINETFQVYIDDDMRWKKTVDTALGELLPVREGLIMAQTLNKFLKWIGLPTIGALLFYWLSK
jgi:hypothetical protein